MQFKNERIELRKAGEHIEAVIRSLVSRDDIDLKASADLLKQNRINVLQTRDYLNMIDKVKVDKAKFKAEEALKDDA